MCTTKDYKVAPAFDLENGDLNRKFCNEVLFHNKAALKSYILYNQYLSEKMNGREKWHIWSRFDSAVQIVVYSFCYSLSN